ncbi:hypothetical protein [Leptospira ellisii]|uniref:hypothetical protein n=1 Tax=Leptospira ellisii TaxID=2023197 RepID=UPI000C29C4AF|nr:hypothetical protein [Leptospira ellisii]PKA04745.1 hypothetical protein CH375_09095 [Leptospira ellisii]
MTRPAVEVLSQKPAALLPSAGSEAGRVSMEELSEFLLVTDMEDAILQNTINPIPVTREEYEADRDSFSGAVTIEERGSIFFREEEEKKKGPKSKVFAAVKAFDLSDRKENRTIYPYLWDNSRIVWSSPLPAEKVSETDGGKVCSPTVIRSGFFPLWKSVFGETVHRTLEGQSYFCSRSRDNTFVFYDIRSYFVTLIQFLLPMLFLGATFLNRRKSQN